MIIFFIMAFLVGYWFITLGYGMYNDFAPISECLLWPYVVFLFLKNYKCKNIRMAFKQHIESIRRRHGF